MANPMEQFTVETIKPLEVAGYNVSFTNSSLWMCIALAVLSVFLYVGTSRPQMIPGRWQAAVEYLYDFSRKILDENVGPKGRNFVPLIFSLFIFVLGCNLLGMIPWVGAFTPTSHISVTLGLAVLVFAIVCVVGFASTACIFSACFGPKTRLFCLPFLYSVLNF